MTVDPRSSPITDGGTGHAALFDSFPDPILVYASADRSAGDGEEAAGDEESLVVHGVNAAFEATFGVESDGVVGSSLDGVALAGTLAPDRDEDGTVPDPDDSDATDPSATTTADSILARVRDAGTAVRFRHGTDGETRHFRVRAVTAGVADEEGYLVFTDVTELEGQRRDLAATVARLERLASVASHDLRNPLEVAEIRLEAARDTGEDVHFEKVAGALDRIEHIVQDVLAVGGGGVDPTDAVALEDVAEAAWETVDTADATLVASAGLPTVRGDADRLRQLFENLFRNSVEHGSTASRSEARGNSVEHGTTRPPQQTREDGEGYGDRSVTVTVEPLPDGFVVVDDGPGIPEELHERAFEAGYSTAPDNSGLGLSIVRQIAREHGWRVSLTSGQGPSADDDGGARFEFTGVERVESGGDGRESDGPAESN